MSKKEVLKYAFIKSLPVLCSYIFLGIAYGILMEEAGFPWFISMFASIVVYTGAFQFVLTTLMAAGASIVTIAVTAFLMNSRQTFYALTFMDDFNQMGRFKPFMIFSLTDESYAVKCSLELPGEEKRRVMRPLAVYCWLYWIAGSVAGGLIGQLLPFSMEGIDFCMTALFIIIFINQWEKSKKHTAALVGVIVGIACLVIFGEDRFMLPALIIVSAILVFFNSRQERVVGQQ
ncbi:MAG: AzlC family ABC transporter permease [Eubacterium sp.]|nr:AzlC family ABC transporter permease [Eubacterium sp.]